MPNHPGGPEKSSVQQPARENPLRRPMVPKGETIPRARIPSTPRHRERTRPPRAACEPPRDPPPSHPKRHSAHQARASTSGKGQPVRHRAFRWREAIPNAEGDLKRNVPVYSAAEREARKARNQSVWSGIGSAGIRCRGAGAEGRGHRATDAFTGLQWSRPIHPPQGDEDIFFRESAAA